MKLPAIAALALFVGASSPQVAITGVKCFTHRTGTDMAGSLRNISNRTLKMVKVYATFDGETFYTFINETSLPPGSVSTFLVPGPDGPADKCVIIGVQDNTGRQLL